MCRPGYGRGSGPRRRQVLSCNGAIVWRSNQAMKQSALLIAAVVAISTSTATFPTDEQAIAHVLSRVGFGARPGDIERVRRMGIQRYLDEQLHPERINDGGMRA